MFESVQEEALMRYCTFMSDYFSRLADTQRLSSRLLTSLSRLSSAANYLSLILRDWSEKVAFLELQFARERRAKKEPISSQFSLEDVEGALFDTIIDECDKVLKSALNGLSSAISRTFQINSQSYFNQKFVSPSLLPILINATRNKTRALFKMDELRKGAKILEAAWKLAPHPDIAETYIHARSGDSAFDRMKRAAELVNLQPGNPDGLMALASAQLAAGEHRLARNTVENVLKSAPRESAWLLLADIEEAETGNDGRVREWLQRAVKAPRDAAWVADGQISDHWLPVTGENGSQ